MSDDNVNRGVTGEDTGMPKDEWLQRFHNRIAERTDDGVAAGTLLAIDFEEVSDGYEDDPEGAADEEMSRWEDDEGIDEDDDEIDDDEDDEDDQGEGNFIYE